MLMADGIYQKLRLSLVPIGLVDKINLAALAIDFGRKGFAIEGDLYEPKRTGGSK